MCRRRFGLRMADSRAESSTRTSRTIVQPELCPASHRKAIMGHLKAKHDELRELEFPAQHPCRFTRRRPKRGTIPSPKQESQLSGFATRNLWQTTRGLLVRPSLGCQRAVKCKTSHQRKGVEWNARRALEGPEKMRMIRLNRIKVVFVLCEKGRRGAFRRGQSLKSGMSKPKRTSRF